jgi:pyruvate,water dikinase
MSVLGEAMMGPPPEAQQHGRPTYAVLSDCYMNFSIKAGYHFSVVDTYCGGSLNRNYIHFRFSGGGAAIGRRERRVQFLYLVLGKLGFSSTARGDMLTARMEKYPAEDLLERLRALGRLTMITRQMDMLMDSDSSPEFFAEAFLAGKLELF